MIQKKMKMIFLFILCILLGIILSLFLKNAREKKRFLVGLDILPEELHEFYYTLSNINLDAYYQRYHFFVKDGKYFFYHECREKPGEYGPTGEADIRSAGTLALSPEEWMEFFSYLKDGYVSKREEKLIYDGDKGPWTFLYWQKDQSVYQEFHFTSSAKRIAFESYCQNLAQKTPSKE